MAKSKLPANINKQAKSIVGFIIISFLISGVVWRTRVNPVGYDGYRAMSCKTFFKILSREFLAVIAHQKMTVR